MNRRALLRTTILALPLATLVACAATTVSQVASDVSLIASSLSSIMPSIATIPNLPASALGQLNTYVADLKSLATQIKANVSSSTIQQVASDVQAFANLALPLIPGGAGYRVVINAVLALLPGLLASVGVASSTAAAPTMTPSQARAVLAAYAH